MIVKTALPRAVAMPIRTGPSKRGSVPKTEGKTYTKGGSNNVIRG